MFLISHRGNITGPNRQMENSPLYITKALQAGYDVEVDVWYQNQQFYLGHDNPQYDTSLSFLKNNKIWCHCKNIDALYNLLQNNIHCFFHNRDDVTLTSRGYVWTYPGKQLTYKSICVLPEVTGYTDSTIEKSAGVCSDYIEDFRKYDDRL